MRKYHYFMISLLSLFLFVSARMSPALPRNQHSAKKPPRPPKKTPSPAAPTLSASFSSTPVDVSVIRKGKPLKTITRNTKLQSGDVLKAGAQAKGDVQIAGQGTLRLKPKSTLRLTTLLRQSKKDPATIDNRFKLDAGTVLIRLRTLTGKSRFYIDTPSAVTAARGTSYLVEASPAGTLLAVLEGRVTLSQAKDPGNMLDVDAGQKAKVIKQLPDRTEAQSEADKLRLEELKQVPLPLIRHRPGDVTINFRDRQELAWIPPGEFLMGSDADDLDSQWERFGWPARFKMDYKEEMPRHKVVLSKGFWLASTPVTVAQYRQFCTETGQVFPQQPNSNTQERNPVVGVTWDDAQAYCDWAGVRLPTEAEWEYAARGGDTGLNGKKRYTFVWGDDRPRTGDKVGNVADIRFRASPGYDPNYSRRTDTLMRARIFDTYDDGFVDLAPVASFRPNPYGLYDMVGNVMQWCADRYGTDYYSKSPERDPTGPLEASLDARLRVTRGSDFESTPDNTRVTVRFRNLSSLRAGILGFRVARSE